MTEERTTPLRERMIEDMRIRGLGDICSLVMSDRVGGGSG